MGGPVLSVTHMKKAAVRKGIFIQLIIQMLILRKWGRGGGAPQLYTLFLINKWGDTEQGGQLTILQYSTVDT